MEFTHIHHTSINLEGLLKNYGRRKIRIFSDENGNEISDKEARKHIAEQLAKGHKLMCMSGNDCEGFDPFEKGCPGHKIENPC